MDDISPTTFSSIDQHGALLNIIYRNWDICPPERPLPPNLPPHTLPYTWTLVFLDTLCQLSNLTMGQRDRAYNLIYTYFTMRIRETSCYGTNQKICPEIELSDIEQALASMQRMVSGRQLEVRSGSIVEKPTGYVPTTDTMRKDSKEGPGSAQVQVQHNQGKKRKWSVKDEYDIEGVEDDEDARLAKMLKLDLESEQGDSRNSSLSSTSTEDEHSVPNLPSIQELPADSLASTPTLPPVKQHNVSQHSAKMDIPSYASPRASSTPTFTNPFSSKSPAMARFNSPYKQRIPSVSPLTRPRPTFPIFRQPSSTTSSPVPTQQPQLVHCPQLPAQSPVQFSAMPAQQSFMAPSPVLGSQQHMNQQPQQQSQSPLQFSAMSPQQPMGYALTPWQQERRQSLIQDMQTKKAALSVAAGQAKLAQQVYLDSVNQWRSFGNNQS